MPDVSLRGLSKELHEALKRSAARNHRSLNGEILTRLEASESPASLQPELLIEQVLSRSEDVETGGPDDVRSGELKIEEKEEA